MPTFREVDVFQKVGNVALAYPKLPSFPEIVSHVFSNERVGIHSPSFIPFFLPCPLPCFLTNMIFSWVYIFKRKCGRLTHE